jgi:hypothetical protein
LRVFPELFGWTRLAFAAEFECGRAGERGNGLVLFFLWGANQCTRGGCLTKIGITNVWVLEGGLAAWKKDGFPVTVHLSTSSEVTERFGIKVIEIDSGATL